MLIDNLESLGKLNWLQVFVRNEHDLSMQIGDLADCLDDKGQLWLSWPKKSSGLVSDLNDEVIRKAGLGIGLVDVKVCSIDGT